jgi:ribosomal protein L35
MYINPRETRIEIIFLSTSLARPPHPTLTYRSKRQMNPTIHVPTFSLHWVWSPQISLSSYTANKSHRLTYRSKRQMNPTIPVPTFSLHCVWSPQISLSSYTANKSHRLTYRSKRQMNPTIPVPTFSLHCLWSPPVSLSSYTANKSHRLTYRSTRLAAYLPPQPKRCPTKVRQQPTPPACETNTIPTKTHIQRWWRTFET